MPIRENWLDSATEEIVEPQLPICDPHHHFWDRPDGRYLLDELLSDTANGHNIRSTVFVECGSMYSADVSASLAPVGETEFVQGIAAQCASGAYGEIRAAAGIVAFADLLLGASVSEVLEAHINASQNRFRGIRHSASWHSSGEIRNSHSKPPQSLYLNKSFQQGFARLADHDLVFDSWLYHTQLEELSALAQRFPNQLIVLDHVGGPLGIGPYKDKREEVFQTWRQSISNLAKNEKIMVKLGGLGMAINGFQWHKQALPPSSDQLAANNGPYIMHCIECFGVERCMFESNFPVDKVSTSYNILWNSFKKIVAGFSDHEKAKLFHDNAVRAYKL